jgi:hypothetical protein
LQFTSKVRRDEKSSTERVSGIADKALHEAGTNKPLIWQTQVESLLTMSNLAIDIGKDDELSLCCRLKTLTFSSAKAVICQFSDINRNEVAGRTNEGSPRQLSLVSVPSSIVQHTVLVLFSIKVMPSVLVLLSRVVSLPAFDFDL